MSKRKITDQQKRRIAEKQVKHRQRLQGTSEPKAEDEFLGPEQSGLIIACFGKEVSLEDAEGQSHNCRLRQHLDVLVPGDNVVFRPGLQAHKGVVVALNERCSLLYRQDDKNNERPVAANVGKIFITLAPEPGPSFELLDRYLVVAKALGLQACIVLNKMDLLSKEVNIGGHTHEPVADDAEQAFLNQFSVYHGLNIPVLMASTAQSTGLEQLNTELKAQTSVFVGQSGVGKSSIISALLPEEDIRVGGLTQQTRLGKHTTTTSRLYHLPQGGQLIDSPGVREFGINHLSPEQVLDGFPEIKLASKKCKFRNCSHHKEPQCGVHEGLESGQIVARRWENYSRMLDSCA